MPQGQYAAYLQASQIGLDSSATGNMKAAVMCKPGPPSVIQLEGDFPKPIRKPGELLVRSQRCLLWGEAQKDVPARHTVPLLSTLNDTTKWIVKLPVVHQRHTRYPDFAETSVLATQCAYACSRQLHCTCARAGARDGRERQPYRLEDPRGQAGGRGRKRFAACACWTALCSVAFV